MRKAFEVKKLFASPMFVEERYYWFCGGQKKEREGKWYMDELCGANAMKKNMMMILVLKERATAAPITSRTTHHWPQ